MASVCTAAAAAAVVWHGCSSSSSSLCQGTVPRLAAAATAACTGTMVVAIMELFLHCHVPPILAICLPLLLAGKPAGKKKGGKKGKKEGGKQDTEKKAKGEGKKGGKKGKKGKDPTVSCHVVARVCGRGGPVHAGSIAACKLLQQQLSDSMSGRKA